MLCVSARSKVSKSQGRVWQLNEGVREERGVSESNLAEIWFVNWAGVLPL